MSYKSRRRWSIFILLVGLPIYVFLVVGFMTLIPRQHVIIELFLYTFFGIAWAFPFKNIFKGVGKADPDAPPED